MTRSDFLWVRSASYFEGCVCETMPVGQGDGRLGRPSKEVAKCPKQLSTGFRPWYSSLGR